MRFAIRVYQKNGFPGNYPYLYKLDKNGEPTKMITFKAKSLEAAIAKMSDIHFCKQIGIPKELYFKSYKLEELK